MKCFNKSTPPGTRDRLFEESAVREELRRRLSGLFARLGYSEISTPTLEYYDVFSGRDSGFAQDMMYKLTDPAGQLLVLRPDVTLPIARVAATRLRNALPPLRLCYTAKVYRSRAGFSGHSNEILQSGMELIGAGGLRADLEIITAAIEALSLCGAPDFRIEIGHNALFTGLVNSLGTDEATASGIREYAESNNLVALRTILDSLPHSPAAEALKMLPRLSGGTEVIERVRSICGDISSAELEYLLEIYENLNRLGHGGKIIIDLGMVHSNQYYTGIIFRGYIEGSGAAVLSGGRYDSLLSEFGASFPATGFAVENDAISDAMLARGEIKPSETPEILIFGETGFEMDAILKRAELTAQGISCELSLSESAEEAEAYAKARGIARVLRLRKD